MKRCHGCEKENDDAQTFCGFCGSPLLLGEFLTKRIRDELAAATQDRSLIETESSIRVFERAWGYFKLLLSVVAVAATALSVGVFWKAFDLRSSVNEAKQAVQNSASEAEGQIKTSSNTSVQKIDAAAKSATDASAKASSDVDVQVRRISKETAQMSSDVAKQTTSLKTDIGHSRAELDAVNQMRPQMLAIRNDLAGAKSDIEEQKKILSSSLEFAKKVFSSRVTTIFGFPTASNSAISAGNSYVVVPPKDGKPGSSMVYMLLSNAPIDQTVELKYRFFVQPRNSYSHVQNILIFRWDDPAENLKLQPLEVTYFPDTDVKELVQALSFHDGRVFADDQPMPKNWGGRSRFQGKQMDQATAAVGARVMPISGVCQPYGSWGA
ncbi:MAG: hypothetical protein JWM43_23 [Acidobacteriaceae bacterium]|nr:hypothetical protein [Acidobacteriaceae bacterium]